MKFSIIIPCYNVGRWLLECLDSVFTQGYKVWECIVVDDESTDGSANIVDEYAKRDSRFKVIHQKNAGEGGARNTGLEHAKGEWIFFLDGDDVMAPDALSKLEKLIQKYPTERIIRFGYAQFKDGDPYPVVSSSVHDDRLVDISNKIEYKDYFVYVWQFIYHKSLIDGMYFDRYKRGADRTFIVPVLCKRVSAFVATDDVFYFYRQRQGSAVNSIPSVQVLCDEMDHRLDVAETMDNCGKDVSYSHTGWIEKYFTDTFPFILNSRKSEFDLLLKLWRIRLKRARSLRGFSKKAHLFFILHTNFLTRYFAELSLKKDSLVCRIARFVCRTGEFSKAK